MLRGNCIYILQGQIVPSVKIMERLLDIDALHSSGQSIAPVGSSSAAPLFGVPN